MKTEQKPKLTELDFYRGLAIIAVISIHTTSLPVGGLSTYSSLYKIYWLVNEGCQFAVPAFFFINGLVLFYNYDSFCSWAELRKFYKKRALFILVPYSYWTAFYFFSVKIGYKQPFSLQWSLDFIYQWLTASAYYHLYFIFVLVQFYFLFPFLLYSVKHFATFKNHLVVSSMLLQMSWVLFNHYFFRSNGGVIAFSYLLPFLLGAYTGINYKKVTHMLKENIRKFIISVFVVSILYLTERWYLIHDPGFGGPWLVLIDIPLYYSFVCLWSYILLYFSTKLHRGRIYMHIAKIGIASFAIYLSHPLFLSFFRLMTKTEANIYLYHLFVILGFYAALYPSLLSYRWLKSKKWAWILFGK